MESVNFVRNCGGRREAKKVQNKQISLNVICMSMPAALSSNSPGVTRGKFYPG
jgi:hypothetical protein